MNQRLRLSASVIVALGAVLAALSPELAPPSQVIPTPPVPPQQAMPAKTVAATREFAVPVLMYHRICELTPPEQASELARDLTVSPEAFESQIRHLKENGFSFLLASEVENAVKSGKPLPRRPSA